MRVVCGSTDTESGDPCQRTAGWGTPSSIGPCREHAEAYTRPRKLTPEVKDRILTAARVGAFLKHCAAVGGVAPRTLRRWLNTGEDHAQADLDTPLADLYVRFQRARGEGAVRLLAEARPEFVLERSFGYTKDGSAARDVDTWIEARAREREPVADVADGDGGDGYPPETADIRQEESDPTND